MKPRVIYRVPACPDAIGKAFGPRTGELFVPNPHVDEYAVVLKFPSTKVTVSGEISRALKRLGPDPGSVLVVARDMTLEARSVAAAASCDVITEREFGWTDASYQGIRQR